jgi:hypothetical protein
MSSSSSLNVEDREWLRAIPERLFAVVPCSDAIDPDDG